MDKKKIVSSAITIGATAALLIGATFAFFTDEETSTGNTFIAGTLDLKVDSECHYFQDGKEVGDGCVGFGDWEQKNLETGVDKFFNFEDIKPGDWGENTISLHVIDNDAWGQFVISDINETDGADDGAVLRENMDFWIWLDQGTVAGFQCGETAPCVTDEHEGDNVWQDGEPVLVTPGPVDAGGETHNIWDALPDDGRMVGSTTYYFGLGWCFGTANPAAATIDEVCDGSDVGNQAQGDSLSGTLSFLVTQHRNNPDKKPLVP